MVEVLTRPEQKNYTPLEPFKSRIKMYIGTGDSSVLDPNRLVDTKYVEAFAPAVKRDIPSQTFTLIEKASKKERIDKAGVEKNKINEAVQTWAEKNSKVINRKKGDKALTRFFEVDPKDVTKEMMVDFYEKYFTGPNMESNIREFIKDVIEGYKVSSGERIDLASLKNDLTSIQSLAGAFGETSSEVIAQLIDAEVELATTDDANLIIKINHEINNTGTDDKRLLKFLTDGERLDAPKPLPPPRTEPPTATPTANEGLEKGWTYSLEDMFRMVKGPVDATHKYFVEDPLETIPLTDEQMQKLTIIKPFFETFQDWDGTVLGVSPYKEIVPYVYDLEKNERFDKGERLTDKDSGLFGLTAASSGTPEKQAKLYKNISMAVIQIHKKSFDSEPDNPLLQKWTVEQGKDKRPNSLSEFENNDFSRPDEEKLLFMSGGKVDSKKWVSRITELSTALQNNKLLPNHLRWIEFLSHSVDVTQLIEINQAKKAETPRHRESEVVINDEWTVDTIFKNYAEASNDLEKARNAVTEYEQAHEGQDLDKDKQFKELNRIRMKKTFFAADYHTALFNIEDVILPEILGVTKDSFNVYQLESAIIDYFTYKFNTNPKPAHIADLNNEMNSLLMSINQEAKKTIPGFKPTTVDEIIRIHEIILKNKLTKIKDGTWTADITAPPTTTSLGDDLRLAGKDF